MWFDYKLINAILCAESPRVLLNFQPGGVLNMADDCLQRWHASEVECLSTQLFRSPLRKYFNPTRVTDNIRQSPINSRVKEQLQLIIRLTKMTLRSIQFHFHIFNNQIRGICLNKYREENWITKHPISPLLHTMAHLNCRTCCCCYFMWEPNRNQQQANQFKSNKITRSKLFSSS